MKQEPVPHVDPPAYPTRDELLGEGDLLGKRLPRGWQLGRDLAGAAAFFLAVSITGASNAAAAPPQTPRPPITHLAVDTHDDASERLARAASKAGAVVAPVFEHGDGRGATGCVAVSPPVFLSEDEAMQVIREELAKQKIALKAGTTLKEVKVAPRMRVTGKNGAGEDIIKDATKAAPLALDGFDALHRVAVEFISQSDYRKLGGVDSCSSAMVDEKGNVVAVLMSTASAYDFKDAAKNLAAEVHKQQRQRIHMGVFYDPAVRADWDRPEHGKDQSIALLRQQAKDFVAWLKKQGAL